MNKLFFIVISFSLFVSAPDDLLTVRGRHAPTRDHSDFQVGHRTRLARVAQQLLKGGPPSARSGAMGQRLERLEQQMLKVDNQKRVTQSQFEVYSGYLDGQVQRTGRNASDIKKLQASLDNLHEEVGVLRELMITMFGKKNHGS